MDLLKAAALEFRRLLNTEYYFLLGKKRNTYTINLIFNKSDFFHIAGLHKLKDLHYRTRKTEDIFDDILNDELTFSDIKKSSFIEEAKERLVYLINLTSLIENNDTQLKWRHRANNRTKINCEFLLVNPVLPIEDYSFSEVYLFIERHKSTQKNICKTFFPRSYQDYSHGQR
ncbi:PBECR4 domain-containing protein [Enterococcus sp. LJL98]